MTAEQMFEELGYKKCDECISPVYIKENDPFTWVNFCTTGVGISTQSGLGYEFLDYKLVKAINQQCKELGWLEEEKKTETNFEHYFEYLSKLNMGDFALIDGRVTKCLGTGCSECDFNGDCIEGKFKWLKQPYKKLPYKLSQFEFDLLNAYKNSGMRQCISNYGTLLEMYGKGHFKGIDTSTPIHEILDNCKVV